MSPDAAAGRDDDGGEDGGEGGAGQQVGAGEGRTRLANEIQLRLGILRGVSDFLDRQTSASGELLCKHHRVEHTGQNAYAAVIDLANWRFTREDFYLERARRAVLRAVDNFGVDPDGQVPVFLPGSLDPRNASTHSADGGACTDVIATLLEEAPDCFRGSERERCLDALTRHVEGFLRRAAREQPIPVQRLWAGTGVARAARLLSRSDWAADALWGCASALDELSADGIAPCIPAGSASCTHPGQTDGSAFHQSRTPAFILYIHEVLGHAASAADRERLRRSLDALVALRDGNGRKVMHNEALAWPWESDYEVASHPFDAFALHRGARLLESALYRNEAGRAMEEWIAHRDPDGGLASHHGRGRNVHCRLFCSVHAAWVARAIEDVPLHPAPRPPLTLDLPASGLVHVERERCVAVLRGRHQRAGNLFGCDVGGGQVQSLVVRPDRRVVAGHERIPRVRFRRRREGSFLLRPAGAPSRLARLRDVLGNDRAELRFRLAVARAEWAAGAWLAALRYPLRHVVLRSLAESSPWFASHLDLQTDQAVEGDVVLFEGGLADRDGRRWPGASTRRRYAFLPDRVTLDDSLLLSGVSGRVLYLLPRHLAGVDATCRGATLRRTSRELRLTARGAEIELTIRGHWLT